MGFLLAFAAPGLVVASVWLGKTLGYPNLMMALPLLLAYLVLPVVQALWDRPPVDSARVPQDGSLRRLFYRALTWLTLPAQVLMLIVAVDAFTGPYLAFSGRVLLVLLTGLFSTVFAVTVAHELIHRPDRADRFLGGVLLSMVAFGTFKVVHLQIHHRYAGTAADFATARRGQNIYSFWCQSLSGNIREAWRCERARQIRMGQALWHSELWFWYGLSVVWLVTAVALWGWYGGLFFLTQALIAILYLDCINFLQHYGLVRRILPNGKPERMQEHHSWTQSMFLDDLVLFNLPRHAHHHVEPGQAYPYLRDSAVAPRYPFNYGFMTLMVLVPALFRRVVHPRLDRLEAGCVVPHQNWRHRLQADRIGVK